MFLRPPKNLKQYGSWALITGSANGIGKALALELASKGLGLVLVDRDSLNLEATCQQIREENGGNASVKTIVIDFSKLRGDEIAKKVEEGIAGLDVGTLINNAGLTHPNPRFLHEVDLEMAESIVGVNVVGTTWVTKAVLPGMLKRKKGAIVNIGSGSSVAVSSYPLFTIYAATKAFIAMLSRSISMEYKQHGIDIQCQVKRKRCFYHLSDSMLVKSAFNGAKKCWFVSVDAFSLKQHGDNQIPTDPALSNQLAVVCFTKTPTGDLYASSPKIGNPEFVPGNTGEDVLNDVKMMSMGVDGEPCNTSFLVNNVRSDLEEIHGTHVEEEHSKSRPDAKKKRKRESKGDENPLEGNDTLLVIEDTLKPKDKILDNSMGYMKKRHMKKCKMNSDMASVAAIVSEINMQYANPSGTFEVPHKQKHHKSVQEVVEQEKLRSSVDSLFRERPEDDHLVAVTREKKKSKKTRKLPADRVIDAEPSFGIEGCKENVGTASKDSDKTSGLVMVSEKNVQHATLSGTVVSEKQKHSKPVQEVVEGHKLPSSSMDSLFTEDGHLVAGSRRGTKESTKKEKLPTDEAVNAELSSVHDVGIECCKENGGIVSKDSHKASGLVIVSEQNDERATLSVQEVVEGHKLPSSSMDSLFTERTEDVHLVPRSSSGTKKSKKKKLPTDEVVNAEPKENVETVSKDSDKASGINANRPDAANEKGETDAPDSGARSRSKGRKTSKKHHSTSVEGFPLLAVNESDNLKKDDMQSRHANIALDDQNFETNHPQKNEERKELSQNHDPEAMLSGKCEPPIHGEADMHSKKSVVSDNLLESTIVMESGKSAGIRRMKVSAKKSVATKKVISSKEHDDNSVSGISSQVPRFGDHSSGEAKKESFLSPTKRKKISKRKTLDTSIVGANGQSDDVCGNEAEPLPSTRVDKTQQNAETSDGNLRKKGEKNDDDGNASKSSKSTDANYQREVSKCDGDSINFKDYFMTGDRNHEVTPVELVVDNVSEAKGSDKETKTKKNAKKVVLPSPATSHDPGNSINSYVYQGSDRRSQGVSKASSKKMGEVVNSSRQEKSLLATPGAIFNGSSESSEDESTTANSDSSTKTPSDNSSSSGFSEGDGKLNLDSSRNGTSGAKDNDGGKSITKSQALASKNLTLDRILKSSSRFKKAKLTATQSQLEDAESQPVDFDSQANLYHCGYAKRYGHKAEGFGYKLGFGHKGRNRGYDSWKFKQIQEGQAHSNSITTRRNGKSSF
ncbi:hypothetical protein RHMOL_Rhmol12G0038800 [Rhododendron molle]|uniref:Uncharacterized protein n=1 Tax=Rhododendron molle TaxID=49168 RepID=A0ACC0LF11_RHOML|nr:hypothetical protein RHMOL_Rhmol12G0038800 [Rhododendron molle]